MTAPPREPTPEMIQAAASIVIRENGGIEWSIAAAWRAMYDAAPAPPAAQPAEPPATDDLVAYMEPTAYKYLYIDPFSGDPIWRDKAGSWNGQDARGSMPLYSREQVDKCTAALRAEVERQAREIAELRDDLAHTKGEVVRWANEKIDMRVRAERAEAERDKWKQRAIDDCESLQSERAERDALREALREITRHAAPIYATSADASVRKGYEVGGYIKWYTIPPHIFDAARAKVKP